MENINDIPTRFVCDETGMLIQMGDATRELSKEDKKELAEMAIKGYSIRTLPYGEFLKLGLKLYEPIS